MLIKSGKVPHLNLIIIETNISLCSLMILNRSDKYRNTQNTARTQILILNSEKSRSVLKQEHSMQYQRSSIRGHHST